MSGARIDDELAPNTGCLKALMKSEPNAERNGFVGIAMDQKHWRRLRRHIGDRRCAAGVVGAAEDLAHNPARPRVDAVVGQHGRKVVDTADADKPAYVGSAVAVGG